MKLSDFIEAPQWVKDAIDDEDDLTPTWVLTMKNFEEVSKKLHELCKTHYAEIKKLQDENNQLRGLLRDR